METKFGLTVGKKYRYVPGDAPVGHGTVNAGDVVEIVSFYKGLQYIQAVVVEGENAGEKVEFLFGDLFEEVGE